MFTPAQVSKITNVASSTLRKYVAQFHQHFSNEAQKQRGRVFNQADLALVRVIKELFSKGLSITDVNSRLNAAVNMRSQDEPVPLSSEQQTVVIQINALNGTLSKSVDIAPTKPDDAIPLEKLDIPLMDEGSMNAPQGIANSILDSIERLEATQQSLIKQIETLQYDLIQTRAALNRLKDDQLYQAERYQKHLNTPWWKLLSRKNRV